MPKVMSTISGGCLAAVLTLGVMWTESMAEELPPDFTTKHNSFSDVDGFGIARAREVYSSYVLGKDVRFGDVEEAFNPFHIEFRGKTVGQFRVTDVTRKKVGGSEQIPMCNRIYQEEYSHEKSRWIGRRSRAPCEEFVVQHGTAVIALVGGNADGHGITGIAPQAELYFASSNLTEPADRKQNLGGSRSPAELKRHLAVAAMVDALRAGDVMLLEIQSEIAGVGGQGGPADLDLDIDREVRRAIKKGIVVVMGAGNAGFNLDSNLEDLQALIPLYADSADRQLKAYRGRTDNGAIIVGATQRDRTTTIPVLGRHSKSNFGKTVHVNAWGDQITTAGYSFDFFADTCIGANDIQAGYKKIWPMSSPPIIHPCTDTVNHPANDALKTLEGLKKQPWYYTDDFGGTSGASAIIAGLAVAINSYAKARQYKPLNSMQMRNLLVRSATTKFDGIGAKPNLFNAITMLDEEIVASQNP